MRRLLVGLALAAVVAIPLSAQSSRTMAKFEGGIGVIAGRVAVVDGALVLNNNAIRGQNGAGQSWVIESLSAIVGEDGSIKVDGRGLVFGAGNNIGRSNNVAVRAMFSCSDPGGNWFETGTVNLDDNGDFRIDDLLVASPEPSNVGVASIPVPCERPLLLITNAGRSWFAAGIPKV